jgi:NAD(P)H-hydrate epimerase
MQEMNDKLYTAAQVRGLDNAAINDFDIPGYELMCRAGRAVVVAARERYASSSRWLILCGPGNNGGDGYVVARLAAEAGVDVTLCSLTDPARLSGDAATASADWQSAGGEILSWPLADGSSFDLAFDALLGTGITRDVDGNFLQAIEYLNQLECPKIAIDIPSGLNADTGCVMGVAVHAKSTVTFVGRKRGMYTSSGPDCCGDITFDDLGIPPEADGSLEGAAGELLQKTYLAQIIKSRLLNSHKGSYGHVLAVGGISGMSGAIRLCGEAALRSGAGLVTIATDPGHTGLINIGRPELMVRGVADEGELQFLLNEDHVIAVGPGLGHDAWSVSLLQVCLAADASLVVDADGLNLLTEMDQPEQGHTGKQWILTPHPAEAARLLGTDTAEVQQDRVSAAQRLALQYHAHVVLKGSGTVIAAPGGEYAICPYGNPGMATAGSGDVLTGIIAALLAQGLTCLEASRGGVLAHALAGDIAKRRLGETALLAGDVTDHLYKVWMDATDPARVETG